MDRLLCVYAADGAAAVQIVNCDTWQPVTSIPSGRFDWVKFLLPAHPLTIQITTSQQIRTFSFSSEGSFAVYQDSVLPIVTSTTEIKPILLVTDLDDTLISIQPGGHQAMHSFFQYWISKRLFTGSKLVYSTGRSFSRYLNVRSEHSGVLLPDLVVTGIGSQAFTVDPISGEYLPCDDFYVASDFPGWDSVSIATALEQRFPFVRKKPGPDEDTPLSVLREIEPEMAVLHFDTIRDCFPTVRTLLSGPTDKPRYLDFIPLGGGKRTSVVYAQRRFGFSADRTIVAGDSGNDIEMMEGPETCVIPANCQQELRVWLQSLPANSKKRLSKCEFAEALVEALQYDETTNS